MGRPISGEKSAEVTEAAINLFEAGIVGIMSAVIKVGDMVVTGMKDDAKYRSNTEIASTAWNLWDIVRGLQK